MADDISIYPKLPPLEQPQRGENYRLDHIQRIQETLYKEEQQRKTLAKKYGKSLQGVDFLDMTFVAGGVTSATIGTLGVVTIPAGLALAGVSAGVHVICKLVHKALSKKQQKHRDIAKIAHTKLNTIKTIVSKALTDGKISQEEFELVVNEESKYHDLKGELKKKIDIDPKERERLIQQIQEDTKRDLMNQIGSLQSR